VSRTNQMKTGPRKEPFVVSDKQLKEMLKMVDTNSFAVISKKLQIPYKEVIRIATEKKLTF